MPLAYSQRGMTAISWLLTMALIAFFALIAIRLVPIYLDGYKVASSLESLAAPGHEGRSPGELRSMLMKRLRINMVSDVTSRDVRVEARGGMHVVNVNYEKRQPLIGNIDVVISFDKSVEVPARQ